MVRGRNYPASRLRDRQVTSASAPSGRHHHLAVGGADTRWGFAAYYSPMKGFGAGGTPPSMMSPGRSRRLTRGTSTRVPRWARGAYAEASGLASLEMTPVGVPWTAGIVPSLPAR